MTQLLEPTDSGSGTNFRCIDWQHIFGYLLKDGVIYFGLNNFAVTPGTGMQVNVDTGRAVVRGLLFQSDASVALTIAAADATNPRYDLVVVRADLSTQTATLAILQGTPAASPAYPALTKTSGGTWEVQVAKILIPAGSSSISSGNITAIGESDGLLWATPHIFFGYGPNQPDVGQDFTLGMTSNGTYMNPNHVFHGDAGTPVKVYPMDHGAAPAALANTEWHLEGMHNGVWTDLIKVISGGEINGAAKIVQKNMSVFSGVGTQTGVSHNLGQTPDIIIVMPIDSAPDYWAVGNITSTTCDIHISNTVNWKAIAIKNS